jgi:D-sedoheptulose 7-phosphate isomerase
MNTKIKAIIQQSIETKVKILNDEAMVNTLSKVAEITADALRNGKKALFCGNGGSAADAQHIAAELSGRFYSDRDPLPAEALHVNSSYMTAVANDYSFDVVYSRMIKGIAHRGDILFAISTSGNSKNILLAVEEGKKTGMITIGMTGETGGKMHDICDYILKVPSADTPRIQESHIMIGHIICLLIEEQLFGK